MLKCKPMSFCLDAVFPQIPSIAAVRIRMAKGGLIGPDTWVTSDDRREFEFCEGNARTFVDNANECVKHMMLTLSGGLSYSWGDYEVDRWLTGVITETLIQMSLARVHESRRGDLEKGLRAMGQWDRHRAASLLASALKAQQEVY